VSALKWIAFHCQRANYILKSDDDAFVNVFALQSYIFNLHMSGRRSRLLLCRIWRKAPVVRVGKWSVSSNDISTKFYPDYCAGLAYILTGDVTRALFQMSLRVPFFWIDDVYVTGRLVAALGGQVNLTDIGSQSMFFGGRVVTAERLLQDRSTWQRSVHGSNVIFNLSIYIIVPFRNQLRHSLQVAFIIVANAKNFCFTGYPQ
jgi:hypothetical protein